MDEFEQLPWEWIGDTGYGLYGTELLASTLLPILENTLNTLLTPLFDFNNLYNKAVRRNWWTKNKTLAKREEALETKSKDISKIYDEYHKNVQQLGLEATAPSLDQYSSKTMSSTVQAASLQAAEHKATSLRNWSKGSEYAGLAFDTLNKAFTKDPDAYEGKHGTLTLGLDTAGDSFANAAMASGNPYAMMAAAAYKGMSLLNRALGNGTDGMTKTDAFLDSNLGFITTVGFSKLNGLWGRTTDKFDVDEELQSEMASSYMDTYGELEDAASTAGKKYGFLSKKGYRKAQNNIQMAKLNLNIISDINEAASDREAASSYEGLGFRNLMALNGGFRSMRAAKYGMKMNLDFARKVSKAQGGIKFNTFEMVNPLNVEPAAIETPELVPSILSEGTTSINLGLTENDLITLGVKYREIDANGNLVYEAPSQAIVDTLLKNKKFINRLTRKYGVKGITFEVKHPTTETLQSQLATQNAGLGAYLPLSVSGAGLSNSHLRLPDPERISDPTDRLLVLIFNAEFARLNGNATTEDLVSALLNSGLIPLLREMYPDYVNQENGLLELLHFLANQYLDQINEIEKEDSNWKAQQMGYSEENPMPIDSTNWVTGNSIITPYTEDKTFSFKDGGSFNVIPEGALHKNKHHMEGAEGLTKKGIPVVTEEDGKKVQQAEIEVNEIIFRLEVTEKLEKLAELGTDEAALEAGKLITEEILHNTHDNTGLIKETV